MPAKTASFGALLRRGFAICARAVAWAAIPAALSTTACGGKIEGNGDGQNDPAMPSATTAPLPPAVSTGNPAAPTGNCEAICAHVIGACAAGASTASCVADCKPTETTTKCPAERDAFLACMLTVEVQCGAGSALIVGCTDERSAFEHCAP